MRYGIFLYIFGIIYPIQAKNDDNDVTYVYVIYDIT